MSLINEAIKELQEAQHVMECDIRDACTDIIKAFKDDTGFTPNSISVEVIDTSTIADPQPQFTVGNVVTTISLRRQ